MGRSIGSFVANRVVNSLEPINNDVNLADEEQQKTFDNAARQKENLEEDKVSIFLSTLMKDVTGRTCLVFVSHPFYVISNRMMAQFVGGEDIYSGLFTSIGVIFREEGIMGFFSGVMPRWIRDILYITLSSLAIYSINNYLVADNDFRSISATLVQFLTSPLVYHLEVVSSCMTVNNCGLKAGLPPNMPIYRSWWSCRQHLAMNGQLSRGSSMLIRYYVGPPAGAKTL